MILCDVWRHTTMVVLSELCLDRPVIGNKVRLAVVMLRTQHVAS